VELRAGRLLSIHGAPVQDFRHPWTLIFAVIADVEATGIDRPVLNSKPRLAVVLPCFVFSVPRLGPRGQALQDDANPIACLVQDGETLIAGGAGRPECQRLFVHVLPVVHLPADLGSCDRHIMLKPNLDPVDNAASSVQPERPALAAAAPDGVRAELGLIFSCLRLPAPSHSATAVCSTFRTCSRCRAWRCWKLGVWGNISRRARSGCTTTRIQPGCSTSPRKSIRLRR